MFFCWFALFSGSSVAINHVLWGNDKHRECINTRTPCLLEKLPLTDWEGWKWTPDFLAKAVPTLSVKSSSDPSFSFIEGNTQLYADDLRAPKQRVNHEQTAQFVSQSRQNHICRQGTNHSLCAPYLYFTGDISSVSPRLFKTIPQGFLQTISSLEKGIAATATIDSAPVPRNNPPIVNLWMAGTNVTTHWHFDMSHNVFLQVHGIKQFQLLSPSHIDALHVWSFLHPRNRKSRLSTDHPNFRELPVISLELKPGDALYVPPTWLHYARVTPQEDLSVSVNVFSDSMEELVLSQVLDKAVPFEDNWSKAHKCKATHALLVAFLQQLETFQDLPPQQAGAVRKFLGRLEGETSTRVDVACSASTSSSSLKLQEMCDVQPDAFSSSQRGKFQSRAEEWAQLINALPGPGGRLAVSEALLEVLANSFCSADPERPVAADLAEWFRLCWGLTA